MAASTTSSLASLWTIGSDRPRQNNPRHVAMLEFLQTFSTLSLTVPYDIIQLGDGIILFEAMMEIAPDYFDAAAILRKNLDHIPYWKTVNLTNLLAGFERFFWGEKKLRVDLQNKYPWVSNPTHHYNEKDDNQSSGAIMIHENREAVGRIVELVLAAALACSHKGVFQMRIKQRLSSEGQSMVGKIQATCWKRLMECRIVAPTAQQAPPPTNNTNNVDRLKLDWTKRPLLHKTYDEVTTATPSSSGAPDNHYDSQESDAAPTIPITLPVKERTFVVSEADLNPKTLVDFWKLPEYRIAKIDHAASVPGRAFNEGFVRRKVLIREPAMEAIRVAFHHFYARKSFWAIVPKLAPDTTCVEFVDARKEPLRFDQRGMIYSPGEEGDSQHNLCYQPPKAEHHHKHHHGKTLLRTTRMAQSVVLVHRSDRNTTGFFSGLDIPDLPLPPEYDLLINPYFFVGNNVFDEVAEDHVFGVWCHDDFYCSTVNSMATQGFLYCFGEAWQELVKTVEARCQQGMEEATRWPVLLHQIDVCMTPAPEYYDIPRHYQAYAAGLLLGMYKNVGVREVWAAGGLVGMYSFARRLHDPTPQSYEREIAMLFAMLREASWGCRSAHVGVLLLHYIPESHHDDFRTFCSLPWSRVELINRQEERTKSISMSTLSLRNQSSLLKLNRQSFVGTIQPTHIGPRGGSLVTERRNNENKNNARQEINLLASRYLVVVNRRTVRSRPFMNFVASVGMEMVDIPVPTILQNRMNVVSECFENGKRAKEELREFSNRQKILPGAALRAANFAESDGGVLNVLQSCHAGEGHVVWMKQYNFAEAFFFLLLLAGASAGAWIQHTGVFHFILALTFVGRIKEEVSIYGTFHVLVFGRQHGHKLRSDKVSQFLVPFLLGGVEASFELQGKEAEGNLYMVAICGTMVGGIVLLTMAARLRFRNTEGRTYEQVMQRDGSIECLLTGEEGTGFRSLDHPEVPGVGPVQAQVFEHVEYNGRGLASSSTAAPYHLSGSWMLAGLLQANRGFDFGVSAAVAANCEHLFHESTEINTHSRMPKKENKKSKWVNDEEGFELTNQDTSQQQDDAASSSSSLERMDLLV